MAHIHEKIDFVAAAYIVHDGKVLLIHHKKQNRWLPVGGHIELDEDSDQAIVREIEEEAGLRKEELIFIENRFPETDTKFLMMPQALDIHEITPGHRHICLSFFVKSRTNKIRLNAEEHNQIRWFTGDELDRTDMLTNVRFLAKEAIKKLNSM